MIKRERERERERERDLKKKKICNAFLRFYFSVSICARFPHFRDNVSGVDFFVSFREVVGELKKNEEERGVRKKWEKERKEKA